MSQSYTKALTAIGFNLAQPDAAATAANEMADLPSTVNSEKAEQNESKTIRNKTWKHLKKLVDDVRKAGKKLAQVESKQS